MQWVCGGASGSVQTPNGIPRSLGALVRFQPTMLFWIALQWPRPAGPSEGIYAEYPPSLSFLPHPHIPVSGDCVSLKMITLIARSLCVIHTIAQSFSKSIATRACLPYDRTFVSVHFCETNISAIRENSGSRTFPTKIERFS